MLLCILLLCALSQFEPVFVLGSPVPGPSHPATRGEVWPKPQQQKKYSAYYTFSKTSFAFVITGKKCTILETAMNRTMRAIRILNHLARHNMESTDALNNSTQAQYNKGQLNEMSVDLNKPCEKLPHFDMDESYELTIGYKPQLKSSSIWGIIRGLESFSQMFYVVDKEVRINATHVKDYPKYKHRGLLLDTARHYISPKNILITLDAMAMNKMNVFHWHITDDESFPFVSEKFPKLSEKGAFHPALVYNKRTIQKIIDYATALGIRVVPEFDVPGHTRSWGSAYPEVLTQCYINDKPANLGPLNPILNATYALLGDLYEEITSVFPETYIHVGGDEIDMECWKSNPKIAHYVREHQMDTSDMIGLFAQNAMGLLPKRNKVIVWQEIFDEDVPLPKDALVQVWQYDWNREMFKILHAGHKMIFSAPWYLDIMTNNFVEMYDFDPRQTMRGIVSSSILENIIGGEACMWGEFVDDTNVISRVWSRASAVAEVLWSDISSSEMADDHLYNRLEEHTCRMRRRGVAAQPGKGPGFCLLESNLVEHEENYNGY